MPVYALAAGGAGLVPERKRVEKEDDMKKRWLAGLASLCLAVIIAPTVAWAAGNGSSKDLDLADGSIVISEDGWSQQTGSGNTTGPEMNVVVTQSDKSQQGGGSSSSAAATTNTISVTGGDHNVTLSGVNINVQNQTTLDTACAFGITGGNVTLTLAGGTENSLQSGTVPGNSNYGNVSFAGLWVKQGATLTIDGSGKLTAKGDRRSSVSGASNSNTASGAGIGACGWGEVSGNYKEYFTVGDITIKSGTVEAVGAAGGNYGGPGIGGGNNVSAITISGGTVNATSGKLNGRGSAGVGCSYGYSGTKTIKTIVISGGKVTAAGNSAGIGGAAYSGNYDITISGGTVEAASKGAGAGIGHGGGDYDGSGNNPGKITITGGDVTAQGANYGAGIGGGGYGTIANDGYGAGCSGTIAISGGAVKATGGMYAPGIGSGSIGKPESSSSVAKNLGVNGGAMDAITISGGTVTAINGAKLFDAVTDPSVGATAYVIGSDSTLTTGIAQGINAGSLARTNFKGWSLATADGSVLQLVSAGNAAADTVKRNGTEGFSAGKLVIGTTADAGGTAYYALPEGYYDELSDASGSTGILVASDEDKEAASELVTALNKITIPTQISEEILDAIRNAEATYDAMSLAQCCYVDAKANSGHTLSELKKALKDTLAIKGGTFGDSVQLTLPEGVTAESDVAALGADGKLTYTKAGKGTVSLLYNGQMFFKSGEIEVTPKPLTENDVTIVGLSDTYASRGAADAAQEFVAVVLKDGTALVKGTDFTVEYSYVHTQSSWFSVRFQGNYSGSISKLCTIDSTIPNVYAMGYDGAYDGQPHGITLSGVPEGAMVTYSDSATGAFGADAITRTDAGSTVVYWKVASNGKEASSSALIHITPAAQDISYASASVSAYVGDSVTNDLTQTTVFGGVTYESSDTAVAEVDPNTGKVTAKAAGTATITATAAADLSGTGNWTAAEASYELVVTERPVPVTRYAVEVEASDGGSAQALPEKAKAGEHVAITASPDAGHVVAGVSATDASGKAIEVSKGPDGTYSFAMPVGKVKVSVAFSVKTYADVDYSAWYGDAVSTVTARGLMLGYDSGDTFGVGASLTRAELAQVLFRASGGDASDDNRPANATGMADVKGGEWYTAAANWAVAEGVVEGVTNADGSRSFEPGRAVTFEEAVKIVARYADAGASEAYGAASLSRFLDAQDASDWAAPYLAWAVDKELVTGYDNGDGTFSLLPGQNVPRERAATVLARAMALDMI